MIYTEEAFVGKVFGHTTILSKVVAIGWLCACDLCGNRFECRTYRITNGSAAKNGCGCKRQGPAGSRPPGPMCKGTQPYGKGR